MPQMSVALGASHRCPNHAEGRVSNLANILLRNRSPEARPSCSRLKLRVRAEQSILTAHAAVQTLIVHIPVLSREGSFRVCAPCNVERICSQLLPPLGIALDDLRLSHFLQPLLGL